MGFFPNSGASMEGGRLEDKIEEDRDFAGRMWSIVGLSRIKIQSQDLTPIVAVAREPKDVCEVGRKHVSCLKSRHDPLDGVGVSRVGNNKSGWFIK